MDPDFDSMVEYASIEPVVNMNGTIPIEEDNTIVLNGNLHIPADSFLFERLTNKCLLAHMEIYSILYRAKAPQKVHDEIIKCIMRNIDNGAFEMNHNE